MMNMRIFSKRTVVAIVGYGLPLLLLTYYFLPHTLISEAHPFNRFPLLGAGGYTRMHALGVAIVAVGLWFSYATLIDFKSSSISLWYVSLLYIGVFISASMEGQPSIIVNSTLVLIPLIVGLCAARLCNDSRRAILVIAILGVAQAAFAFKGFINGDAILLSGNVTRASGTFADPLVLAELVAICVPLAFVFALEDQGSLLMALWIFALSLLLAALILAGSRAAMLAMVPSLTWIAWRMLNRWTSAIGLCTIMVLLCLFISNRRTAGDVNEASAQRSNDGHFRLMRRGVDIFRENWITGVGVTSLEIHDAVQRGDKNNPKIFKEPKNVVVHWLAEIGIAGGILFTAFVISISRVLKDSNESLSVTAGLGGSWIALGIVSMFDTPFGLAGRDLGTGLFGALLGATLMLGKTRLNTTPEVICVNMPRIL